MRVHNGIGLAANQAGLDMSMLVCEVKGKVLKLVNPCIVKKEGKITYTEGCLSFPGIELNLKRAKCISVEAFDENGEKLSLTVEDTPAVVLQHEIDHLNGIPFIARARPLQRLRIAPQIKALKAKNKHQQ